MLSQPSVRVSRGVRPSPGVWHIFVFALISFLFLGYLEESGLHAQLLRTVSVRDATDYQGDQPVPGRLGQNVIVQGTITGGPVPVGAHSSLIDLQDPTGGITVYSSNRALLEAQLQRGDEVRVQGSIQQYNGQTEILLQRIERLGPGTVPKPRDVLVGQVIGTRYLGQLVRVEGKVRLANDSGERREITISDRSGELPIYVGNLILQDAKLFEQLAKGGFVTIVGIANYYRWGEQPEQAGYRLIPRDSSDFTFRPVPPYKSIALGMASFLLLVVCTFLVLRRRNAERQAKEMAVLLENLQCSEKAWRQSEQRYRRLFERNPAGLFHSTPEGRILNCNESFARIFGYASREEVLGSKVKTQDFYLNPAEHELLLAELRGNKAVTNLEVRLRKKDGSPVWVLENACVLEAAGDSPTLVEGTLVDITEHKQLEQQFRQVQKMDAIGRLAGGVGHDLNNLLTIISGHTELLLGRIGAAQPQCHNAIQIRNATNQAAALIRQLLAFSRMQVLQPRVLNLNSVLAETSEMLPRLLREDIEVVFLPSASSSGVQADQNQIQRIILNLAANARDAMPNGGKLTIETANVDLDESYVRVHPGMKPGAYVMLAVTDTGTGMDAETQTHIFEPFFTTKERGKGTGLGLATVYGIVKQSAGWIWVYSEVGRGTTVKIYLPRVEAAIEADRPNVSQTPPPGGTETVLLVDDQQGIRDLARPFLEAIGYSVLEASDGEAALEVARRYTGKIDLLLTDIVMPKMGGFELARRLTALHPESRVLYMSGYAEYVPPTEDRDHREGFRLQKPFSMSVLARSLRQVLNGEPSAGVRPE